MTLWGVFVLIIIFCIIVWVARGHIPAPFSNWIVITAAVFVIITLLWGIGLFDGMGAGHSIRIR